jgi:hypothetical protein
VKRPLPLVLALAALAACSPPGARPTADVEPTAMVSTATIQLIAKAGDPCDDRTAPQEVELPVPEPALWGALHALLDAGRRYEGGGHHNTLADSPLRVVRIERQGDLARIYLTGYLELADACDRKRVPAQLVHTATQFKGVRRAEIFLDGKPLSELLAGK